MLVKTEEIDKMMRCPVCNVKNSYYVKTRQSRVCKSCGHEWKV